MVVRALNVAEKPSVTREIATLLGQGRAQRRNGVSQYNHVFEFPFNLRGEDVQMVFTSVLGHVMGLDYPKDYKNWSSCDPIALFDAPVEKYIPENMEAVAKNLQKEARGCKYLILWLDCDREGENIAFEVVELCCKVNPRLQLLRAHFSSLNSRDIYRAMETLTAPNKNDSLAVDARMELDLRIGAAYTRFQTMRLQNKFQGLGENVISYGPCQFPTLGFVVTRYWEIKNFVPEDFWKIECTVKRGDGIAHFNWKRFRLYDKVCCVILYELCVENPQATVVDTEAHPKKKYRPFPMTTVIMQKLAAQKLHFSSEETMRIAEGLYQKGYLSYPRTETDSFNEGTDLRGLIQLQAQDNQWGNYVNGLLHEDKFRAPKKGQHNDNSHPPIHPTKHADNLSGKDKQLYDFITRHFLACCSDDGLGQETVVTIDIAGEIFTCKGLVIEQLNWLEVYPYEKWTDKNLPRFQMHETFMPTSLLMTEGTTTAPSLISEAELITIMDKNGIGTDATIAQHIQTIQDRGYAHKQMPGALFTPTTLGEALVYAYDIGMGLELAQSKLRAQTEADMKRISMGEKTKDQFMAESVHKYKDIFIKIMREADKLDEAVARYFDVAGTSFVSEVQNFSECGKCHDNMSFRTSNDGQRVLFCPQCKVSQAVPKSGQLAAQPHRCPLCNYQVITVQTESNTTYHFCPFCRNNPPKDQVENQSLTFNCFNCSANCPLATKRSSDPVKLCSVCKTADMVIKKKKDGKGFFLGCKGYPTCRGTLWLPHGIASVDVSDHLCPNCTANPTHKLRFVFNKGVLPLGMGLEYCGCIGCDEFLLELPGASSFKSNQAAPPVVSRNPTNPVQPKPNRPMDRTFLDQSFNNLRDGVSSQSSSSAVRALPTNNFSQSKSSNSFNSYGNGSGNSSYGNGSSSYGSGSGNSSYGDASSSGSGTSSYGNGSSSSGFSGGSSGFSGGASGQLCYTCNQPGHFSSSCPQKNQASNSVSQNSQAVPNCPGHQEPCAMRTVGKEGPNKGRKFFVCAKPQDQQCQIFEWADEIGSSAPNRQGSTPQSGNFSNSSDAKGLCYKCQQPGHYASSCPNGGTSSGFGSKGNTPAPSWNKKSKTPRSPTKYGGGSYAGGGGPATKKRKKCSVCGQEGHDKRKHEKG